MSRRATMNGIESTASRDEWARRTTAKHQNGVAMRALQVTTVLQARGVAHEHQVLLAWLRFRAVRPFPCPCPCPAFRRHVAKLGECHVRCRCPAQRTRGQELSAAQRRRARVEAPQHEQARLSLLSVDIWHPHQRRAVRVPWSLKLAATPAVCERPDQPAYSRNRHLYKPTSRVTMCALAAR